MRPTVLLFDIDGTLVTTGGVGRRALERSFDRVYGRLDACSTFRLDGMTDRAIARQGLVAIGVEPTTERIDALLDAYLAVLEEEVAAADAAKYRLHPGMREAVDEALSRGCAVGFPLRLRRLRLRRRRPRRPDSPRRRARSRAPRRPGERVPRR